MTDDDLESALCALALEEPPADLHRRILAATVYAVPAPVATWELWALGTLLALVALGISVFVSATHGSVIQLGSIVQHVLGFGIPSVLPWLAVGVSSVWWISSLTLMPRPEVRLYNNQA